MEKLVFEYSEYEEAQLDYVSFEYSSKADFITYILHMCDEMEKQQLEWIYLFEKHSLFPIDGIRREINKSVYTLKEWFEKNQHTVMSIDYVYR